MYQNVSIHYEEMEVLDSCFVELLCLPTIPRSIERSVAPGWLLVVDACGGCGCGCGVDVVVVVVDVFVVVVVVIFALKTVPTSIQYYPHTLNYPKSSTTEK